MAKKKVKKERNYHFYKDYAKFSEGTLEWVIDNDMERAFVTYLKLKRVYRNGYIKNPLQHFQKFNLGISKATFKRRLVQLENIGFIEKCGNNIRLVAINKLPVRDISKRPRFVKIHLDILSFYSLRGLLIKKSERTQKFRLKHSENSGQEVYSLVNGKLMGTNTRTNKDVNLSCSGIAEKINRCKVTAHRLKRMLHKQGLLRTAKRLVYDPNGRYNTMMVEGNLFRRTSDIVQTTYPMVIIRIVPKTTEEKIISMYTNDCF